MNNNNSLEMLYETLLSTPGMTEKVKLDLKISRAQVLLLVHLVKQGLKKDNPAVKELMAAMSDEMIAEMTGLADDFLSRSGLTELNKKLPSA